MCRSRRSAELPEMEAWGKSFRRSGERRVDNGRALKVISGDIDVPLLNVPDALTALQ